MTPPPSPDTAQQWTVRICDCGCVHDRPDAGCPECGSHAYKTVEVVDATLLTHEQKVRGEAERERERDALSGKLLRARADAAEQARAKAEAVLSRVNAETQEVLMEVSDPESAIHEIATAVQRYFKESPDG